ncbi:MAG: hypothetical protein V1760_02245 [Candidatus Peregrinibacteria bacterium]
MEMKYCSDKPSEAMKLLKTGAIVGIPLRVIQGNADDWRYTFGTANVHGVLMTQNGLHVAMFCNKDKGGRQAAIDTIRNWRGVPFTHPLATQSANKIGPFGIVWSPIMVGPNDGMSPVLATIARLLGNTLPAEMTPPPTDWKPILWIGNMCYGVPKGPAEAGGYLYATVLQERGTILWIGPNGYFEGAPTADGTMHWYWKKGGGLIPIENIDWNRWPAHK